MKRLLLIMFIAFFSSLAGLSPEKKAFYIIKHPPINPYERIWRAVCLVESNNDPLALNKREQAYGIVQIRAIRLKDYKKRTGISYDLKDMYDVRKSKEVFFYYCRLFGEDNIDLMIRRWNGSGAKTYDYLKKVKKHL